MRRAVRGYRGGSTGFPPRSRSRVEAYRGYSEWRAPTPRSTTNLLPFGNIALTVALAPVGVIAILVIGLGIPHLVLSYGALTLAIVASVLALLLPIRGTHRQMARAKRAVLARLNGRIQQVYDEVIGSSTTEALEMARLANRANTLIPLRKTVQEMTTWPFRDTVTFGRAVLIASAPIVYALVIELLKPTVH
jgi:hypothetical protein